MAVFVAHEQRALAVERDAQLKAAVESNLVGLGLGVDGLRPHARSRGASGVRRMSEKSIALMLLFGINRDREIT